MHSLPIFAVVRDRPVILVGEGGWAEAKRRLLERAGARVVGEEASALLAIVAVEDEGEAEAAVARLKARGILVNAVDRPMLSDYFIPAIVDRDPVLVAVGTGGASAGLSKALRQRLERMLPAGLGSLAETMRGLREAIRERWPGFDERRRAIEHALDEGGPLDPFAPHDPDAVATWLASGRHRRPRTLATITLRSLDPHDLTIGEAILLGRADRVLHEPGVPAAILDRARADAARIEADAPPREKVDGLTVFVRMPRKKAPPL